MVDNVGGNTVYADDSTHSMNIGTSSADLGVRIISDVEEFLALKKQWNELAESSAASIFQTFEWSSTWWKYFGAGKELFIIILHDAQHLVGIVPFFQDTVHLGGWHFCTCLRLLGSTIMKVEGKDLKGLLPYSDYLDIIVRPGSEEMVCQALLEVLEQEQSSFQQIIFDEVPEQSVILSFLVPLLQQRKVDFEITDACACAGIALHSSWQEYLSDLSKSSRYKVRKFLKKAHHSKHKIFEIERVTHLKNMDEFFEILVALHQQRWHEVGYPGSFAERRFHAFIKEMVTLCIPKGWAQIYVLKSIPEHDKCVAVDLIFTFNNKYYLSQRAFDITSTLSDEGPGNVLLYQEVKDAIEKGCDKLDFMRGEESYKFRSANYCTQNKRLMIRQAGKLKTGAIRIARGCVKAKRQLVFERDSLRVTISERKFLGGLLYYLKHLWQRLNG